MYRSFRQVIELLDSQGKLIRVSKPVDPRFEMPALMKALEDDSKAFIFENVKGSDYKAVGGLFTSMSRYGLIFNDDGSEEFTYEQAGQKVMGGIANPIPYNNVESGPVIENVLTGSDIDLTSLPAPTFFELDTGPFLTAAVGIFKKPNGTINVGFYRCLIINSQNLLINASGLSDLRKAYAWHKENEQEMRVAMVLGAPPALLMAAASKSPDDISELDVAGGINGDAIDVIFGPESGLPIPVDCEMAFETIVDLDNMVENTLGEFGAQYGTEHAPMCKVTSMLKRNDAMFYTLMAGRAKEHNNLGYLTVYGIIKGLEQKIKETYSNVRNLTVHFDTKIGPLMHLVIAIKKNDDDEPGRMIKELFEMNMGFFNLAWMAKRIIIVDDDVDPNDMDDVAWATWTRIGRAEKLHTFSNFVTWEVDRAALPDGTSVRIGVDATKDMDHADDLVKPTIPNEDEIKLKDYL
ncbi:MAG TPA: UbiD family decarboxylase [Gammaproteobacteria bacterium]|mgnify:FL=1|nr:UbiD family decarboxylase [Gammaproteobacteria bacterium]